MISAGLAVMGTFDDQTADIEDILYLHITREAQLFVLPGWLPDGEWVRWCRLHEELRHCQAVGGSRVRLSEFSHSRHRHRLIRSWSGAPTRVRCPGHRESVFPACSSRLCFSLNRSPHQNSVMIRGARLTMKVFNSHDATSVSSDCLRACVYTR